MSIRHRARLNASLSGPALALAVTLAMGCAPRLEEVYTQQLYDLADEALWTVEGFPVDNIAADGSVSVRPGGPLSLYVRIPQNAVLAVDGVERAGGGSAPLAITLERAGDSEFEVASISEPLDRFVVQLPQGASQYSRLVFSAKGDGESGASWLLRRPRILGLPAGDDRRMAEPPSAVEGGAGVGTIKQPNVIIYLVDTLRADHLETYGYHLPVSPHIQAFSKQSIIFDDAVTPSPWTKPAVASLFSGVEPPLHGVMNFDTNLPKGLTTLAESLRERGYRCEGQIANLTIRRMHGFGQGFMHYEYGKEGENDSDGLMERVWQVLDDPDRLKPPFFLYVHAMDPHVPYRPPAQTREVFAPDVTNRELGETDYLKEFRSEHPSPDDPKVGQVIALYDAEIAFTDFHFGRFVNRLQSMDLYDDSLIVFVADHGEEFWDRGWWGHGHSFARELVHVPLMIKPPRGADGRRVSETVRLIDIPATVLDYASVGAPETNRGRSLRPYIEGTNDDESRVAFSFVNFQEYEGVAVTTDEWKLILPASWKIAKGNKTLFDRKNDAWEETNVYADNPIVASYLESLINRFEATIAEGIGIQSSEIEGRSEEEIEQLRALGYVD